MTLLDFKASLQFPHPDSTFSVYLKSLWYDGKGDWDRAHAEVDQLSDRQAAWVHAYLHRKEGDIWNADYWYKQAGRQRPSVSLAQEWEQLVNYFLTSSNPR
ncbi:hypothetical protein DJ568_08210 [Mucilaginibacter hurinus]|uniref:Uncharacterized protein n=1 Tax=Mucilaginibacter hurinus TaxID=2201324 RepID=A0A367GNU1_9SPHI|nr:hypothetical protein [Mucilaginibacter hurinus]RCH55162.1 hypothetical protein DJ568_08210 [Mucilaginibacter hurinus]